MDHGIPLKLIVAALFLLVVLLLWVVLRLLRWGRRQREVAVAHLKEEDRAVRRNRAQIAQAGEQESLSLLAAAGYEVLASQERALAILMVDGEEQRFEIKPDHLVEKNGALYVADVKTGREASLKNAKTRRQLLEYKLVFKAEGALLVDMAQRCIREVEFINYAADASPADAEEQGLASDPAPHDLPHPTATSDPSPRWTWSRLGTAVGAGFIVGASSATWWLLR